MSQEADGSAISMNSYSVSRLLATARDAIDAELGGPVWVEGEISGFKKGRNNHTYFDLIETDDEDRVIAKVSVALWAGNRAKVNARFKDTGPIRMDDGVRVRIIGPLELWLPGGRIQLNMQDIDPEFTLELIDSERDRVLALLRAEGLIDRNRHRLVPAAPRRIGLVTAIGSAAEADFLKTLHDSGLAFDIVFVDAQMQGIGAERQVSAALRTLEREEVDLIALVRGGGARTDLATFDHERIARTIATLEVPVFTGIGHEIDTSVADVVANQSFKTPTACAAAIAELQRGVIDQVEEAWHSIATSAHRLLERESTRLARHARHATMTVRSRLTLEQHRLTTAAERSNRSALGALRHASGRVDVLAARLAALDPARALARGWTITRTTGGVVVRSIEDVNPGDALVTQLVDGIVTSTVSATEHHEDS
jgi:exodeoxyribonuclease VII large subunit